MEELVIKTPGVEELVIWLLGTEELVIVTPGVEELFIIALRAEELIVWSTGMEEPVIKPPGDILIWPSGAEERALVSVSPLGLAILSFLLVVKCGHHGHQGDEHQEDDHRSHQGGCHHS